MLNCKKQDASKVIVDIVKSNYDKNTEDIAVSVSIDVSNIETLIQIDLSSSIVVGSVTPDHFIDIPNSQ